MGGGSKTQKLRFDGTDNVTTPGKHNVSESLAVQKRNNTEVGWLFITGHQALGIIVRISATALCFSAASICMSDTTHAKMMNTAL